MDSDSDEDETTDAHQVSNQEMMQSFQSMMAFGALTNFGQPRFTAPSPFGATNRVSACKAPRAETSKGPKQPGIWYRHSGQDPVEGIPSSKECRFRSFNNDQEILQDIGTHHITHLWIYDADLPTINLVAPKATVLKIEDTDVRQTNTQLTGLERLTELKELYIDAVGVSNESVDCITKLTSLEKLELFFCHISDLPQSFSALNNLKHLQLGWSLFSQGLPAIIPQLTALETLKLDHCSLTELPASLSSLINLKMLDLSGNKFSTGVPDVVSQMTMLEKLDLHDCNLSDLPVSLKLQVQ